MNKDTTHIRVRQVSATKLKLIAAVEEKTVIEIIEQMCESWFAQHDKYKVFVNED